MLQAFIITLREGVEASLIVGIVFAYLSKIGRSELKRTVFWALGSAVVATATGGIPEVVDDGVTGLLVPIEQVDDGTGTPVDPDRFVADLAAAITALATDPDRAAGFGRAGRRRAVEHFSWASIADRTMEVYRSVL